MIDECNIIEEISRGGQKIVYLAEHPSEGKVVIKKGEIKSFTSLERIKREVELLSELSSEYYPKQFQFNVDIKSKKFEIVEEFIEGKTLRESVSEFRNLSDIFNLLFALCTGLKIIWDENIVHRDLKPENIIIRPDKTPCIIDLGIARFLDLEALTKTISPMGPCTPVYAAPEQLANRKELIDPRTDFFALGIISLELYLGEHPFDPNLNGNLYSIVENISDLNFVTYSDKILESDNMTEFAKNTLCEQPYQRFRNHNMISNFIANQI